MFIEHANSITNSISSSNLHNFNCALTLQLLHSSFLGEREDPVPHTPLALSTVTSPPGGGYLTFESLKITMQPCLVLKVFVTIQEMNSVTGVSLSGGQAVRESDW